MPSIVLSSKKSFFWWSCFSRCSYNVITLRCIFSSQGISLCFIAVKIAKTSLATRNFFRAAFFVCFSGFGCSFLKKSFLYLGLESSISGKIRNFLRVVSFYFLSSENSFLKCFILKAGKFHFRKYKENFF